MMASFVPESETVRYTLCIPPSVDDTWRVSQPLNFTPAYRQFELQNNEMNIILN